MGVNWSKDIDQTLAGAKEQRSSWWLSPWRFARTD